MAKTGATKLGRAASLLAALAAPVVVLGVLATPSGATSGTCSTSSGASSCTIATSVQVTAGTLGLESTPSLYWGFDLNGYDQWASGSSAALTCSAGPDGTTCSGGSAPMLEVVDATGSGSGWAVSAYLSGSLPGSAQLWFDGAGSTSIGTQIGNSTESSVASNPYGVAAPGTVCDYSSTCTPPTLASSGCTHESCQTYSSGAVELDTATSTSPVDLYSAKASTGLGAICFGTGTATAVGCAGTTKTDFYNLALPANTAAPAGPGSAVLNLTVASGP